MSVSWQNRRRWQSLVAHSRVKKQQQNNNVFKLCLNELTDGEIRTSLEVWHSSFVEQRNNCIILAFSQCSAGIYKAFDGRTEFLQMFHFSIIS